MHVQNKKYRITDKEAFGTLAALAQQPQMSSVIMVILVYGNAYIIMGIRSQNKNNYFLTILARLLS